MTVSTLTRRPPSATLPAAFKWILDREPRLQPLVDDCAELGGSALTYGECMRVWYREIKPRMFLLVGFGFRKPELQGCDVYDTAYRTLTELAGI